jgi:thioredoxin 1
MGGFTKKKVHIRCRRCGKNSLHKRHHQCASCGFPEVDVINSDIPVFVDFWAEWCGPCRMVGPVVEELANDYDGKVKFVKVNVDEANELASKYNVFSIPTLILLNKGEIVSQQVGAASKESYQSMIDRALA